MSFDSPIYPIEWQGKEAQAHMLLTDANTLRWICGQSKPDDDPVSRYDLERLGFTVVRKEKD